MVLRKRAKEITELVKKAQDEISMPHETIAGGITVASLAGNIQEQGNG